MTLSGVNYQPHELLDYCTTTAGIQPHKLPYQSPLMIRRVNQGPHGKLG